MPTKARVVVLPKEKGPLSVVEMDLPDPGPYEVVVKQFASGICHTQLHQIHNDRTSPLLLGHEGTGVVIAKGNEVTHVKEGDHVILTWIPTIKASNPRRAVGQTLRLPDGNQVVSPFVYTWADNTIADEQYVVRIPKDTVKDVTAIIGCPVMTGAGAVLHSAGVKKGESVAIIGVGGVGLSAVAAAKVVGADPIIAVDLDDEKLQFARQFGATVTINASKEDPIKAIKAVTHGSGVDYAFDCIGRKETVEQLLPVLKAGRLGVSSGGIAVLVAAPPNKVELNSFEILANQKKLIGSLGGSCIPELDIPVFLEWYKKGQLDLNALVTQRYKIDQINEAVAALEKGLIKGRAILEF